MPDFRYVCITLTGEYLRGEYTAEDKNKLAWALWDNKMFLVWWEELGRKAPEPIKTLVPVLVPREEMPDLWNEIWQRGVSPVVGILGLNRELQEATYGRPRETPSPLRNLLYGTIIVAGLLTSVQPYLADFFQGMKWRHQYRQAVEDINRVIKVAKEESADSGTYPPAAMPGSLPPRFEGRLHQWPQPPCPGWSYSWDNWQNIPGIENTTRVTLRDDNLYAVYYRCIESSGSCAPNMMWGHGRPIDKAEGHRLTCKERITD